MGGNECSAALHTRTSIRRSAKESNDGYRDWLSRPGSKSSPGRNRRELYSMNENAFAEMKIPDRFYREFIGIRTVSEADQDAVGNEGHHGAD